MRVVITGVNSAVGLAILRRGAMKAAPAEFIAAVCSARAAERIRKVLGNGNSIVRISFAAPDTLAAAFNGASAVIHLPGVLIERPGSSYEQGNVMPARSVVEAAKKTGAKKLVLISATGADEKSSNRYYRTKGQAEASAQASGLSYTTLRAPLLLGPGTEGPAALKRNASRQTATLIGGGRNLHQPLHVDDLAHTAILAARPDVASNLTLNIVEPTSLPDREIVERAARLQGRKVRIRSIPKVLIGLEISVLQLTGRGGLFRDALEAALERGSGGRGICRTDALMLMGRCSGPIQGTSFSYFKKVFIPLTHLSKKSRRVENLCRSLRSF